MIAGFTGSQGGMTVRQKLALGWLLFRLPVEKMRNGDCIGADDEAYKIFTDLLGHSASDVLIHPSTIWSKRAFNKGIQMHDPLPPLQRNKYIAGWIAGFRTDLLVAAPAQNHEILRSGTWATVRYARQINTPRIILLP